MVNAYRFLSSKSFSVFAFTTAILLKIALRRIFFLFGSDKLGQVVVTLSFYWKNPKKFLARLASLLSGGFNNKYLVVVFKKT